MNQKYTWNYYGHKAIIAGISGMVVTLYLLVFFGISPIVPTASQKSSLISIVKQDHADLKHRPFSGDINSQKNMEVTRVYPTRFSPSLENLTNINLRKETFVNNLLPSILAHNERVQAERAHLLKLKKIKDTGKTLSFEQVQWLNQLALKYKLRRITIAELLKRVDVIPPSLALGQAVVETGWGGSSAAQHFNSPFGMMKSRTRVFSYNSLQESVSHYIHNLNTHDAYAPMRIIRAKLRNAGEHLCSFKLVEGLKRYSELGMGYTRRVKNIIKTFGLQQYDQARLSSPYQQS